MSFHFVLLWVMKCDSTNWDDVVQARDLLKGSHKLAQQITNCTSSKVCVANVDQEIEKKKAMARHTKSLESIHSSIAMASLHHNEDMAMALLSQARIRLTDVEVAGKDCKLREYEETKGLFDKIESILQAGANKVRLVCIDMCSPVHA